MQSAGAVVYGVNPASAESHRNFVQKQSFPFPLLVDKGCRIARAYRSGFWLLVRRTVYIVDPEGRIGYSKRGKPTPVALLSAIVRFRKAI